MEAGEGGGPQRFGHNPIYPIFVELWNSELAETEQITIAINNLSNVKPTAQFIVEAFDLRNKLLFLKPRNFNHTNIT